MIKYLSILIVLICIVSCNTSNNENAQMDVPANTDSINTIVEDHNSKPIVKLKDSLLIDSIHVDSIPYIMTNFYDLKGSFKDSLESVLNTQDLSRLGNENVYVLMNFANDYLFKNNWRSYSNYHAIICYYLPEWIDSEINRVYCGLAKDLQKNVLAYCIYRIDRSPENLLLIYQTYRSWFISKLHLLKNGQQTINHDRIVNSYNLIDLLLEMHNTIIKIEDHKTFLSDIYEKVDLQFYNEDGESDYYWEDKYGNIGFGNLYDGIYQNSSWALSFWTRRHHEGNMEVVHEILLDLKKELDNINYTGNFKFIHKAKDNITSVGNKGLLQKLNFEIKEKFPNEKFVLSHIRDSIYKVECHKELYDDFELYQKAYDVVEVYFPNHVWHIHAYTKMDMKPLNGIVLGKAGDIARSHPIKVTGIFGIYVNGLISKKWYDNGQIMIDANNVNGYRNGLTRHWHQNGNIQREEIYKNGLKDGISKYWRQDGSLQSEYNYKKGILISEKRFDDSGKPIEHE